MQKKRLSKSFFGIFLISIMLFSVIAFANVFAYDPYNPSPLPTDSVSPTPSSSATPNPSATPPPAGDCTKDKVGQTNPPNAKGKLCKYQICKDPWFGAPRWEDVVEKDGTSCTKDGIAGICSKGECITVIPNCPINKRNNLPLCKCGEKTCVNQQTCCDIPLLLINDECVDWKVLWGEWVILKGCVCGIGLAGPAFGVAYCEYFAPKSNACAPPNEKSTVCRDLMKQFLEKEKQFCRETGTCDPCIQTMEVADSYGAEGTISHTCENPSPTPSEEPTYTPTYSFPLPPENQNWLSNLFLKIKCLFSSSC